MCLNYGALDLVYSPERDHPKLGFLFLSNATAVTKRFADGRSSTTNWNYVIKIHGVGSTTADQLADIYGTV